jgi:phospholipid/cholesterol/gamma-HCH transport system substrate-binding protein
MLVNVIYNTRGEHRRLMVFGLVFLVAIAVLVGLSIAIYNKAFKTVDTVTIRADRAGLQLERYGDVRQHGVLVGQVRKVDQNGTKATITVALSPKSATAIPENVGVQILPTTLFGQKYISFTDPKKPSSKMLSDGDVIPSSRVTTNVELSKILADLFPLLRAVRPADLNATLNAVATALEGRGEQIGESLTRLDSYLTAIQPHLGTFRQDLVALADVSHTYEIATPDLVRLLRNATVTSRTILDKRAQLGAFFDDVSGVSSTTSRVLADNEAGLIRFGQLSRPMMALLDTYSPEYPCLLKGLDRYTARLDKIFRNDRIYQKLELGATQKSAYDKADKPVYGEVGHGPWCLGLPYPKVPIGPNPLKDGSDNDSNPSQSQAPGTSQADPLRQVFGGSATTSGYSGTPGEQHVVEAYLATRTGKPVTRFSSMSSLLYGPLIRGRVISS